MRRRRATLLVVASTVVVLLVLGALILTTRHGVARRAVSAATRSAPNTSAIPPSSAAVPRTTTATTPPTATPATASWNTASLSGDTITIDPGHNGQNFAHTAEISRPVFIGTKWLTCDTTGTETDSGYTEAAYNLDVALRLQAILRGDGATVVMTRTDNNGWGPCIDQRAAIGNQAHAAVAISIHADGGPPTGRGFHVIYPPSVPGYTDDIATQSYRLALAVRAAYAAGTGMPFATYLARGTALSERSDLGGLNLSNVPKVFVETGNMRNATDAALLNDPLFRQHVAQAIAQGLTAYLDGR